MNRSKSLMVAAALCGVCMVANAQWRPAGVFAEAGIAEHGAYSATFGGVWPWAWKRDTAVGELTAISEGWISQWRARQVTGRESFTQLGFQPLLRLRFAGGVSPWFAEAGIGVTYTDEVYHSATKTFSTKFNFKDTLGVGRSFGADRKQELGLRVSHFSNASIKRPNPGENFLQLRYAHSF
ncbi:MAG: acyloxyacyl hydrolase [Pseudomonadota bacterium]